MAKKRQGAPPVNGAPKPMPATMFVQEFAMRQNTLLENMVQQLKAGAIAIDDTKHTDRYIESVVAKWCESAEPDTKLHLEMIGAIFLWALIDEVYADDVRRQPDIHQHEPPGTSGVDLAMEALRTIRSIWGRHNG